MIENCFETDSQWSGLLFFDSRSESTSNRCIVNFVGQDDSICVSPNMSYSENFVSYEAISVSNNSHCATYLLHTNKTSSKGRSFISTKVKHLPSRSKDFYSNGMASINRNFKDKGSKETSLTFISIMVTRFRFFFLFLFFVFCCLFFFCVC